ncbi:MAG: hypothetical protein JWP98_1268, partial [Edaphobacter sp.]|nr:hypothetical protein [Edaphobacter sp.]
SQDHFFNKVALQDPLRGLDDGG